MLKRDMRNTRMQGTLKRWTLQRQNSQSYFPVSSERIARNIHFDECLRQTRGSFIAYLIAQIEELLRTSLDAFHASRSNDAPSDRAIAPYLLDPRRANDNTTY